MRNDHHSRYLQRAWNKYGPSSFLFELIEVIDIPSLLITEQMYLDIVKPVYNLATDAISPSKGRKLPPASPERKEKIRLANLGNKHVGT